MDFAQEHTGSYYAATVNDDTSYPRLKDDLRVDVCIIGGGPAGITLAFVSAGLGMSDYPKEILFSLLLGPPALWGFMYLLGEFTIGDTSWGWGIGVLAVIALFKAAVPGGSKD